MKRSLKESSKDFREQLLDLLWRQWTALGVQGHESGDNTLIVDPEALLVFTCTVGRHDPRLFDEMVGWLNVNGSLVNIQRLKRIMNTERFSGGRVIAALAGLMSRGAEILKWKNLSESAGRSDERESLFFTKDGGPLPTVVAEEPHFARYGLTRGPLRARSLSQPFQPGDPANLLLQLRALFGINVRSEIVLYLLTHECRSSLADRARHVLLCASCPECVG